MIKPRVEDSPIEATRALLQGAKFYRRIVAILVEEFGPENSAKVLPAGTIDLLLKMDIAISAWEDTDLLDGDA